MSDVQIDSRQLQEFFNRLGQAGKMDFNRQIGLWFEALGFEFLDIIQDEIIRKQVVDTRRLLNSFDKGTQANVWKTSYGGLTLEVGTNVKYAKAVNDGHWLNPSGVSSRFVPGTWNGDTFVYQSGAQTGMILRQKFIPGRHYWDSAMIIFEKIFQQSLERKLEQWLSSYF